MFKLQYYHLLRKSKLQKYTRRNKICLETTWSVTESFATPKFIMTMYYARTKNTRYCPPIPKETHRQAPPFHATPLKIHNLSSSLTFFVYYWEKTQNERNWHNSSHNFLKKIKSHQLLLNFRIFLVKLLFQHEKLL